MSVNDRVAWLTQNLGAQILGDWWLMLVEEPDEVLEATEEFLRVPCDDEQIEERSRQGIVSIERELVGRLVRREWIKWAHEQPNPKASWLVPWSEMAETDREADRRIGYACVLRERSRVTQ